MSTCYMKLPVTQTKIRHLDVLDFIDTTPLLNTGTTSIPKSSATPVTIVASLANEIQMVQSVEDIGEFIGLYSDPAGTPVLECILPLGGGAVEVKLPAGTALGLRNMKDVAISTGYIAINFKG